MAVPPRRAGRVEQGVERGGGDRGAALLRDVAHRGQAAVAQRRLGLAAPTKPTGRPMTSAGAGVAARAVRPARSGAQPMTQTAPGRPRRQASRMPAAERVMPVARASAAARRSATRQTASRAVMPAATIATSATTGAPARSAGARRGQRGLVADQVVERSRGRRWRARPARSPRGSTAAAPTVSARARRISVGPLLDRVDYAGHRAVLPAGTVVPDAGGTGRDLAIASTGQISRHSPQPGAPVRRGRCRVPPGDGRMGVRGSRCSRQAPQPWQAPMVTGAAIGTPAA